LETSNHQYNVLVVARWPGIHNLAMLGSADALVVAAEDTAWQTLCKLPSSIPISVHDERLGAVWHLNYISSVGLGTHTVLERSVSAWPKTWWPGTEPCGCYSQAHFCKEADTNWLWVRGIGCPDLSRCCPSFWKFGI